MIRLASYALVTFNLPLPTALIGRILPYASVTGSVVVASSDAIDAESRFGYFCKSNAAAPVTWGAAILVPLVKLYPPPNAVEFTKTPGATRSGLM